MKTLKSMRLHIGFFGKTNVGKSSLINRISNQDISIVSEIAGTTTDVVEKSMELLPIGPVTLLDTAGLDDKTELAEKRIEKTMKIINRIDIAVIVCEPNGIDEYETDLIKKLDELKIPYLIVVNKCDKEMQRGIEAKMQSPLQKIVIARSDNDEAIQPIDYQQSRSALPCRQPQDSCRISKSDLQTDSDLSPYRPIALTSAETINLTDKNLQPSLITSVKTDERLVFRFKEALVELLPDDFVNSPKIAGDLIPPKSTVILVIPIDKEAPKGRIILPQVQTLRDLLDSDCLSYVVKETELKQALENLKTPPALVVTDSQAFRKVSEIVPDDVPLTSFSILFARLKGDLDAFISGANAIDKLKDGDKVLILESCTHHAIEDDIGRVKIPALLRKKTGKNLEIKNIAGHDFPDINDYKLIIHCGACMTNRREVLSRILTANNAGIPITNYGIVISYCLGILPRATRIFENLKKN